MISYRNYVFEKIRWCWLSYKSLTSLFISVILNFTPNYLTDKRSLPSFMMGRFISIAVATRLFTFIHLIYSIWLIVVVPVILYISDSIQITDHIKCIKFCFIILFLLFSHWLSLANCHFNSFILPFLYYLVGLSRNEFPMDQTVYSGFKFSLFSRTVD